ncbi:hypothetical protein [Marinobacter gelidimuriae]|uniref:hypothetical protein n=1 Tax=Marinobacter gelidimuriae TaxID=2739064 RepID=UPI00036A4671|nr:hypothetical protein [Marinobacter gelidimuriae]
MASPSSSSSSGSRLGSLDALHGLAALGVAHAREHCPGRYSTYDLYLMPYVFRSID